MCKYGWSIFFVTIAPSLTKTITIFIYTALGLTIAHGDIAELLALAIWEQTDIGWDKLLLGKLLAFQIQRRQSGMLWHGWTLLLTIWSSLVYGARKPETPQCMERPSRSNIKSHCNRHKIKAIYEHPLQMASHFHSIFDIAFKNHLKINLHTHHNFQCLLRQHKPMKTHIRTMRCIARSQAKEQQLPETPYQAHRRAVQAAVKAICDKLYQKWHPVAKTYSFKRRPRQISSARGQWQLSLAPHQQSFWPEQSPSLRRHPP